MALSPGLQAKKNLVDDSCLILVLYNPEYTEEKNKS